MGDLRPRHLEVTTAHASEPATKRSAWRIARTLLLIGLGLFVLIQLIPYGRSHANPTTTAEPRWDSPRTRELAATACFDCHSNETQWGWYSNVAPFSWLVQRDVEEGRSTLNFSEWDQAQDAELEDLAHLIQGGEMPPNYYGWVHGAANLTDAQKRELIAGLEATFQASPPIGD